MDRVRRSPEPGFVWMRYNGFSINPAGKPMSVALAAVRLGELGGQRRGTGVAPARAQRVETPPRVVGYGERRLSFSASRTGPDAHEKAPAAVLVLYKPAATCV